MKQIGSHPGAFRFRFIVLTSLILIMVVLFFRYVSGVERSIEIASIEQTNRIINSSLMVSFSNLAIKGELKKLNVIAESNPFLILSEYQLLPANYHGSYDREKDLPEQSGWYYLEEENLTIYQSRYQELVKKFRVTLDFEDKNKNNIFDPETDLFRNFYFGLESRQ